MQNYCDYLITNLIEKPSRYLIKTTVKWLCGLWASFKILVRYVLAKVSSHVYNLICSVVKWIRIIFSSVFLVIPRYFDGILSGAAYLKNISVIIK